MNSTFQINEFSASEVRARRLRNRMILAISTALISLIIKAIL